MATVPTSGTNIRLLSGIPFQSDYQNTRWFDSLAEQTSYFDSRNVVHSMVEANFQRIEGQHIVRVDKSIDSLLTVNYLRFQNTEYNTKWFYAFVTKLEYVRKDVTHVHFQLDVLQTWRFQMNFKQSYVEREHCQLLDVNNRPIINTIDEGLYYGSEYENVKVDKLVAFNDVYFLVVVCKQPFHDGETLTVKPTLNAVPQPLTYYVHPFKLDGTSPFVLNGSAGVNLSSVKDLLETLYTNENAQNNIVSLYITEFFGQVLPYVDNTINFPSANFDAVGIFRAGATGVDAVTMYAKNIAGYEAMPKQLGDKYNGFVSSQETKLFMHPYAYTQIIDFQGNQLDIKNEFINDTELTVELRGSLGTANKTSASVRNYRMRSTLSEGDKNSIRSDYAMINNNPNDVPIVTDMLSAYMQGNRNSIVNQQNSIQFNGLMDIFGGINNVMAGAIGGASGFGVASGVMGTVQGAGNIHLQLQALQAKRSDLKNVPPSMTKMGNNSAFDYGYRHTGVFVIKKQITAEYRQKLESYFKMFGYKVNRIKMPNFHTRQHFNYIKTVGCIITGDFNNEDLNELKAIFNNGITLWHTNDVGNYTLENEVIANG